MLTVNKHQTERGLTVELQGALEENVNLDQLVGHFTGELRVKCRAITRINSVGVKTWMRYFQGLRAQGKPFVFEEVPQPLIEQLNMISNFACGGEVISLHLPYSCLKCQKEFVAHIPVAELRSSQLQIPNVKCEESDCAARFDDDPKEYLSFLDY